MNRPLRSIVILGGGSAGWMTAAALARALDGVCRITVIEPSLAAPDSGALTPCEAALPALRAFNGLLGFEEDALLIETGAGFRLGTEFVGWDKPQESYIHPLGDYGGAMEGVAFHQYWLALAEAGEAPPLEGFSLAAVAGRLGRFARPSTDPRSVTSTMSYGLHLPVRAYAGALAAYAVKHGVTRLVGELRAVERREDGLIAALRLDDERRVEGDLFVDCTGQQARLVGGELQSAFADWSTWLPCDSGLAVEEVDASEPGLLTQAAALRHGWSWRMPLPGRTWRGLVYPGRMLTPERAADLLLAGGDSGSIPERVAFRQGRRTPWVGNCVAIGISAACFEPLEWTGLHLAQSGVARLLALLPDLGFSGAEAAEYNRLAEAEAERVRDFLILHYRANRRRGEPLWDGCRTAPLPEPLAHKIRLWESRGRVVLYDEETFLEPSWIAVFLGQGLTPQRHHRLAEQFPAPDLQRRVGRMRELIGRAAEAMPRHGDTLARIGVRTAAR